MKFSKKLEEIKKQILEYYEMSFDSDEEDYSFNKSLKEKLGCLITENSNEMEVKTVLITLAESTGCAEDQEIAEIVLDDLFEKGLISEEQIGYFYENTSTRRWF